MAKQIKAVATCSSYLSSSLGLIHCGRKNRLSQAVTSTHTVWQARMHVLCWLVFHCCDKDVTNPNLERKGVFHLTLPCHTPH